MGTGYHVGVRVRAIRKRRGLTQEKLAALVGRSVEAISTLERGRSQPTLETLERLSEQLDVPIREFFDFDERDQDASSHRIALLAAIADAARTLSERDLKIAAAQIDALAARGRRKS